MSRYNIAFLPINDAIQFLFQEHAVRHFGAVYDDYILGEKALMHVTLCQFYAETDEVALRAYQSLADKTGMDLTVSDFCIRAGTLANAGKFIANFNIEKTPLLMKRQTECFNHLTADGLTALTPKETYSPHITMARLSTPISCSLSIEDIPRDGAISFSLSLGVSTESGMYIACVEE